MPGSKHTADDRRDTSLMPGRPGYRTQPGRSGYDPLETQQEAGYVAGVLLRKLVQRVRRLFSKGRANPR